VVYWADRKESKPRTKPRSDHEQRAGQGRRGRPRLPRSASDYQGRGETILNLSKSRLTSLPPEIAQLKGLTSLDLSDNQLTRLPREVAELTNLSALNLRGNRLSSLPREVAGLTTLTELNLGANQLTSLPAEIGQLERVMKLDLSDNQVTSLPRGIAKLKNLDWLLLSGNGLTSLPPEVAQLTDLLFLDLDRNHLTSLPPEIVRLTNLKSLDLSGNQLASLPSEIARLKNLTTLVIRTNRFASLSPEIGQLTNLNALYLADNQLASLPPEIAQLKSLALLSLWGNRFTSLPREIARLPNLTHLDLDWNQLTSLPPEIAQLTSLTKLDLRGNRLTSLPPEIAQLTNLRNLVTSGNQLTSLPPEIAQLKNLTRLDLSANQLTSLAPDIGQVTKLERLEVSGNPLADPPPEVVDQGTQAILAYLRAKAEASRRQWVSKLLLVGEGGAGKTSLLRKLRGEDFNPQEDTTHGVMTSALRLAHPELKGVTMQLNTWDFGGQQIYHATHQFFLTRRSLYLVVWNARQGFEQGKFYYWLDTLQARAPESPVLLVATCTEDRPADLPLSELQKRYPQIKGSFSVSNRDGTGIDGVREAVAKVAAGLPLMGERWPAAWLGAAKAIRSVRANSIPAQAFRQMLAQHNLSDQDKQVLSRWLHELGDIVYFQDDRELNDVVLLQPDWVTATICRVLDSDAVKKEMGVLTRECMEGIWDDLDRNMQQHFLRLMERFDLSYRTLEDRDISIVVERLSWEPPAYQQVWQAIESTPSCKQVSMKFQFGSTVPAGLPTWFIARSHRFTTHTHWRQGALFADSPAREHLALVRADAHDRSIRLTVRGPAPHNFFALLRDGLELTIARFPGLPVQRLVPCPGHDGEPCPYEFDFANLDRAIKREKPVEELQCPVGLDAVSVPGLLFGIHWGAQDRVLRRIDELEESLEARHREQMTELRELRELAQREFLNAFRRDQANVDVQCPNVFVLTSSGSGALLQTLSGPKGRTMWAEWGDKLGGAKLDLQLCCQMPGAWHPAGKPYQLRAPAEWLQPLAPYLRRLVSVLKYAAPLAGPALPVVGPAAGLASEELQKRFKHDIEFTEALVEKLPEFEESLLPKGEARRAELAGAMRAEGAELRALRHVLDRLDPAHAWGGLSAVWTPEGHCLWLCQEHAAAFRN
jgi:internalin A